MFGFCNKNKKGFTLVELLVVVSIIGLISTVAIIALSSARRNARNSKRVAQIKEIAAAMELYYADNGTYLVTGCASGAKISTCNAFTSYFGALTALNDPSGNIAACTKGAVAPCNYAMSNVVTADGIYYEVLFGLEQGSVGALTGNFVYAVSPDGLDVPIDAYPVP